MSVVESPLHISDRIRMFPDEHSLFTESSTEAIILCTQLRAGPAILMIVPEDVAVSRARLSSISAELTLSRGACWLVAGLHPAALWEGSLRTSC